MLIVSMFIHLFLGNFIFGFGVTSLILCLSDGCCNLVFAPAHLGGCYFGWSISFVSLVVKGFGWCSFIYLSSFKLQLAW